MKNKALGLLEVQGYSVALAVMDKACKAADIEIKSMDCNNPKAGDKAYIPVVVQVKFIGSVSDVKVALEVARETAVHYISSDEIVTRCIPCYDDELEKILNIGKVKNKQI